MDGAPVTARRPRRVNDRTARQALDAVEPGGRDVARTAAILGQLDGAAFRLAALAARRFPEGEALDAYLDGDAGLADYLRCGEPECAWGVAPGSTYCQSHRIDRQRAQQRAYRARQGEPEPPPPDCCGNPPPWPRKCRAWQDDPHQADARAYEATAHELARGRWADPRPLRMLGAPSKPTSKRCGQHEDAHNAGRGYGHAWAAGARGLRRVSRLYELFGQDGRSWGAHDAAGRLDSSDDGRPDRLKGTPTPYVPLGKHEDAERWFARHPGWVNHPLPESPPRVAERRRLAASWLRPDLDRLAEIHRIRHVNGYWPWSENVRVLVRGCMDG
jgi:hypothetical protein